MYNFNFPQEVTNKMSIFDRKWFIERFIAQKQKEKDAYDREMKKGRK